MASSAKPSECLEGPEKRGCGGRGRLGLPPYLDEGVPGRGEPLMSDGSYWLEGGGRAYPLLDNREGLQARELPKLSLRWNGTYVESGGGMAGPSIMDECDDTTEGWYVRCGGRLLDTRSGEPRQSLANLTDNLSLCLGDPGQLSDFWMLRLRGEGPSGRAGRLCAISACRTCSGFVFFRSSFTVGDAQRGFPVTSVGVAAGAGAGD